MSRIATTATPDVLRLRGRRRVLLSMSWGLGQFSGCLFVLSRRLHLSLGRVGEDDVDSYIVSSSLREYEDQGLSKIPSFGLERKGAKRVRNRLLQPSTCYHSIYKSHLYKRQYRDSKASSSASSTISQTLKNAATAVAVSRLAASSVPLASPCLFSFERPAVLGRRRWKYRHYRLETQEGHLFMESTRRRSSWRRRVEWRTR